MVQDAVHEEMPHRRTPELVPGAADVAEEDAQGGQPSLRHISRKQNRMKIRQLSVFRPVCQTV
jgi:hypothetical protein